MGNGRDRLVWIDCEMTGLDIARDELVEVAVVITDFELNLIGPGFDVVIAPSQEALDNMGEFVRNMHSVSGLLEELPNGITLDEAQTQVLAYIREHVPTAKAAPIAGNSIGTDRTFLAKYMPLVDDHLHYRSVDVSTIKELSRHWFPRAYFNSPEKHGGHRATADILESIRELRYYREAVFVSKPGPSTDDVKAVAERVVSQFTPHL
ncbi:oligoribonuclease [Pseudoclavibacter endophyticus]|uniref:Oligoribonuclease n=1 Tax=Pseudoclavibacter endophyticus TaxID=1778590 RepID=A0A6H9WIT1_9MICO|nr:oligoribonuclease [Pseudoclavibacter endophyticus]KAB1646713.1 oligoribonuclease [Pseudoclavibacter endophyticus]